jgi:ribonuclease HI
VQQYIFWEMAETKISSVVIYTDGACLGNPGRGGYGVVLLGGGHRKELSAGYRKTTNNRMEIMGPIAGLSALKKPCSVTLFSDSQYVVNAMSKGWVQQWKARSWRRSNKEKAMNSDLWEQMLSVCKIHQVRFSWVRGHDGNIENERCDVLAVEASNQPSLLIDTGYENSLSLYENTLTL